jgi:hypothetical protein
VATKTAFPGTTSSGDVLHSADITKLPGGWIGYVEKTVNQTGISGITDITSLSVTVTVNTTRTILITGHFGAFDVTSNCYVKGYIREGSTTLGVFVDDNLLAGQRGSGEGSVWLQPTAGSHTYFLSMSASAGTVDLDCTANDPGSSFILVQDLGPA